MRFNEIITEEIFQYVIDGYGYHEDEEIEYDGDNSKKWHYMTTPKGERITLDHSPYQQMDKDEFAAHVAKHKGNRVVAEAFGDNIKSPPFQSTKELETAYMQLCDLRTQYETIIDMQKESINDAFLSGYNSGVSDGTSENWSDDSSQAALDKWKSNGLSKGKHSTGSTYRGEPIRIIKTVKDKSGKITQYKIEDMNKTWTNYVRPDQLKVQ